MKDRRGERRYEKISIIRIIEHLYSTVQDKHREIIEIHRGEKNEQTEIEAVSEYMKKFSRQKEIEQFKHGNFFAKTP